MRVINYRSLILSFIQKSHIEQGQANKKDEVNFGCSPSRDSPVRAFKCGQAGCHALA